MLTIFCFHPEHSTVYSSGKIKWNLTIQTPSIDQADYGQCSLDNTNLHLFSKQHGSVLVAFDPEQRVTNNSDVLLSGTLSRHQQTRQCSNCQLRGVDRYLSHLKQVWLDQAKPQHQTSTVAQKPGPTHYFHTHKKSLCLNKKSSTPISMHFLVRFTLVCYSP